MSRFPELQLAITEVEAIEKLLGNPAKAAEAAVCITCDSANQI
jgi:hypothetical protein